MGVAVLGQTISAGARRKVERVRCFVRRRSLTENFLEVVAMTNGLTKTPETAIAEIEKACIDCNLVALQRMTPIRRTLALAKGMQTIRKHLSGPIMADIIDLANTPLGFLTDRRPGQGKDGKEIKAYPEAVIRDAVIEGMLRGASIVGNEINIIAGRCYLTRAYFERAVREWPGLSDLAVVDGVPTKTSGSRHVLVPMRATWKLNGERHELRCEATSDGDFRIPVIENEGMAADAVIGKARRKMLAKIFGRLTGSEWISEQASVEDVESTDAARLPELSRLPSDIAATLESIDQLLNVDAYEADIGETLVTDDDKAKLKEWCDWRREAIRESRGSQAKQ
jgi:hypothetical protein